MTSNTNGYTALDEWECKSSSCASSQQIFAGLPNAHYRLQIWNEHWRSPCDYPSGGIAIDLGSEAGSRMAPQLAFSAYAQLEDVQLEWATNSGWRNDYFVVEHSTDGENFTDLQTIANTEWSDELAVYKQVDKQPINGVNYYRVKQVYSDNSFDYTAVQRIDFHQIAKLSVYPNPANDEVFLNLNEVIGEKVEIQLYNYLSQQVYSKKLEKVSKTTEKVPLQAYENGVYLLSIKVGHHKVLTKKIVISRMY